MPTLRPGTLNVQDFACAGDHTWILTGRLDRDSAVAFATMAAQLGAEGATSVVVDLGNLAHLDDVGLAALVRAKELCEARGCSFSLAPLSRAFKAPSRRHWAQRPAELTGDRTQPAAARGRTKRLGVRRVEPIGS